MASLLSISRIIATPGGEIKGKAWVIDGDNIVIRNVKIRLAGIDAPELDQPWGRKARSAMIDICIGHVISARLTGETSYDRLVATCTRSDGVDIGAELIRRGLAIDYTHFSGGKYLHLEPPGVRDRLLESRAWHFRNAARARRPVDDRVVVGPWSRRM